MNSISSCQPRFGSARPLTEHSALEFEPASKELKQGQFYIVQEGRSPHISWLDPASPKPRFNNGKEFRRAEFTLEEPKNPVELVAQHVLAAEIKSNKFAVVARDQGKLWLVADGLSEDDNEQWASNIRNNSPMLLNRRYIGFVGDRHPVSRYWYRVDGTEPVTYISPITTGTTHSFKKIVPPPVIPASVLDTLA